MLGRAPPRELSRTSASDAPALEQSGMCFPPWFYEVRGDVLAAFSERADNDNLTRDDGRSAVAAPAAPLRDALPRLVALDG